MKRLILVALACLMLGGCTATGLGAAGAATGGAAGLATLPSVVPNPSIFSFVGRSNTKLAFISPGALVDNGWPPQQAIIQEQCIFHTSDPMFLVPTEVAQKGWAFAGRLNPDEHHFQVNEYKSILTLGLYGAQQLNTWPVSLIALSDFPRAYLEPRLAMVAAAKLDAADQKKLQNEYIANAARIEAAVRRLESTYNPAEECIEH